MKEGWIKLYRKALKSTVFEDPLLWKVWCWCLMKASHTEQTIILNNRNVHLKPGQFVFGRRSAAVELLMSPSTVERKIKVLNVNRKLNRYPNHQFTLIEVVNWQKYQESRTAERTAERTQNEHIQECKYKGLEGFLRPSLADKDLEKCNCPRCRADLEFRKRRQRAGIRIPLE
ncbi:MAG: hypothetical protein AB1466_01865 [Actinomycetota bacterium]